MSTTYLGTAQVDHFPNGGFYAYCQEHPDIQPSFEPVAELIADSFELEAGALGHAAVLAWGPSGIGKSSDLVPAVARTFHERGYSIVPRMTPKAAASFLDEGRISTTSRGIVIVLDEFCDNSAGETIAESARGLWETVKVLEALGVVCVDARHLDFVSSHSATSSEPIGKAIATILHVPVSELVINLDEVTPPAQSVEQLLKILGVEEQVARGFANGPALRNIELLRRMTDQIAYSRLHGNAAEKQAETTIDQVALEELLRNLPVAEGQRGPWFGFRTPDKLVEYFRENLKN